MVIRIRQEKNVFSSFDHRNLQEMIRCFFQKMGEMLKPLTTSNDDAEICSEQNSDSLLYVYIGSFYMFLLASYMGIWLNHYKYPVVNHWGFHGFAAVAQLAFGLFT